MNPSIARLRERFRPEQVEVLLIAESPPESHEDEVRFFYNPRQERFDYLYRSVMKAIFPDFRYRKGEKEAWLRRFQSDGYYLIDATDRPLNRLRERDRRREIEAAIPALIEEIGRVASRDTPLFLVKKNVFQALARPLRDAGYDVAHEFFLPFPSHGHQARFIEEFRGALRRATGRI